MPRNYNLNESEGVLQHLSVLERRPTYSSEKTAMASGTTIQTLNGTCPSSSSQHPESLVYVKQKAVVDSETCSDTGCGDGIAYVNDMGQTREHAQSKQGPKNTKLTLFDSVSDIGLKGRRCDHGGEIAIRTGEREVYSSTGNILNRQETRSHKFSILDVCPTYSVDLKASPAG